MTGAERIALVALLVSAPALAKPRPAAPASSTEAVDAPAPPASKPRQASEAAAPAPPASSSAPIAAPAPDPLPDLLAWQGDEPDVAVLRRRCAGDPAGPLCDELAARTAQLRALPLAPCDDLDACARLARRDAWLGDTSPAAARACALGDAAACLTVGAPDALRAAAALGHPGGDAGLAHALIPTTVRPDDLTALHQRLAAACDAGWGPACTDAGQVAEDADLRVHPEALYARGCALGHADGCLAEGRLYELGIGVHSDGPAAVKAYREACRLGAGPGCAALGWTLMEGEAVEQDVPAAIVALTRGAALGDVSAAQHLVRVYTEGYGGLYDPAAAVPWRTRACALGDKRSCR